MHQRIINHQVDEYLILYFCIVLPAILILVCQLRHSIANCEILPMSDLGGRHAKPELRDTAEQKSRIHFETTTVVDVRV